MAITAEFWDQEFKKISPFFLCCGDQVCHKKRTGMCYGSWAQYNNNKLAVVRSLLDFHFHAYAIIWDDSGDKSDWIPRTEIRFLKRDVSDANLLQSCYGALRRYRDLPVTYPEHVMSDSHLFIPDNTFCLYVDHMNGCVMNCITMAHDTQFGATAGAEAHTTYTIMLENGLVFDNIDQSLLYANDQSYYIDETTDSE